MTYNNIKKQILNSTTVVIHNAKCHFINAKHDLTLDKRYLELTTHLLKKSTTHLQRYTLSITLNTK